MSSLASDSTSSHRKHGMLQPPAARRFTHRWKLRGVHLAFILFAAGIALHTFSCFFNLSIVAFCLSMVFCWLFNLSIVNIFCSHCLRSSPWRNSTVSSSFAISSPRKRAASPCLTDIEFVMRESTSERMFSLNHYHTHATEISRIILYATSDCL